MSGRTKRILYHIADAALFLLFDCGTFVLSLFYRVAPGDLGLAGWLAVNAALLFTVFRAPVLLHECGHALFGFFAGMKLASFRVVPFGAPAAGMTAMFPKNERGVRAKFLLFTVGGAAVNLLAGGILLLVWLLLSYHPAALFCGAVSGSVLSEGIRALIPCELRAGKTDGAVLRGVLKGAPEEEIALRVLTAQGYLYRGGFAQIPKELLFSAPVVREDLPAYHALLLLQGQYLLSADEKGEGQAEADEAFRRALLIEDLSEAERREFLRYLGRDERFIAEKTPFAGVRQLEERLARGAGNKRESPV